MFNVRRRELIALLGSVAATWPLAVRAQQAMPVIGFLDARFPDAMADRLSGLRQGLGETGYVEGDNVTLLYRWAENKVDRLPELAAELVRRRVAAIIASGGIARAISRALRFLPPSARGHAASQDRALTSMQNNSGLGQGLAGRAASG